MKQLFKLIVIIPALFSLASCASPTMEQPAHSNPSADPATANLSLEVTFAGGTAAILPGEIAQPFTPVTLTVAPNTCNKAMLESTDTIDRTFIRVCYIQNVLYVDPNRFSKSHGAVSFASNPIWRQGYTYQNITTSGVAKLRNATIGVRFAGSNDSTQCTSS